MRNILYATYLRGDIPVDVAKSGVKMLKEQGEINNPTVDKILRCKMICICYLGDLPVAIGAIKPKTVSDFNQEKADLVAMSNEFEWELGYCYTRKAFRGKGISSSIVRILLEEAHETNLMASTKIHNGNPMVKILEKNGFRLFGKPWKSSKPHGALLGLFLRAVSNDTCNVSP